MTDAIVRIMNRRRALGTDVEQPQSEHPRFSGAAPWWVPVWPMPDSMVQLQVRRFRLTHKQKPYRDIAPNGRIDYNAYIKSAQWQQFRMLILVFGNYRCAFGAECCTGEAVQVHHRNYKTLGCETWNDVLPVCVECHDCITAMGKRKAESIINKRAWAAMNGAKAS